MNLWTRKNRIADMMPERRGEMNHDNTRKWEAQSASCCWKRKPRDTWGPWLGWSHQLDLPIFSNSDHLTPSCPWATSEKPMVAPTMQWVPEMGSFKNEAISCHTADPGEEAAY